MDRLIEPQINTQDKELDSNINQFISELQNVLENSNKEISIDKGLYNEIYNELELAPKYSNMLENIITESMLEYSYDTEFLYVNYDSKNKKYYIDHYDGELTRINVTKKELQDADYKVGDFYVPILDGDFLEEVEYVKESIKENVKNKLENLEKNRKRGKNAKQRRSHK